MDNIESVLFATFLKMKHKMCFSVMYFGSELEVGHSENLYIIENKYVHFNQES